MSAVSLKLMDPDSPISSFATGVSRSMRVLCFRRLSDFNRAYLQEDYQKATR